MKKHVIELEQDSFYHIFNRGINAGAIFFNSNNYHYFLKLFYQKIDKVAKIHCYCLMQNHFHLLVKTKSEQEIRNSYPEKSNVEVSKIISQQFSNAFNSYTQAINKSVSRTGKLFELPFRRKLIEDQEQLIKTILYIHYNPAKHNIEKNIFQYPHSSFKKCLMSFETNLELKDLFSDVENFKTAHRDYLSKY